MMGTCNVPMCLFRRQMGLKQRDPTPFSGHIFTNHLPFMAKC